MSQMENFRPKPARISTDTVRKEHFLKEIFFKGKQSRANAGVESEPTPELGSQITWAKVFNHFFSA